MSTNVEGQASPSDAEIFLVHGAHTAVVSPYGASLRGYSVAAEAANAPRRDVVTPYAGAQPPSPDGSRMGRSARDIGQKIGGQGDVLIPFPGRIRDGLYTFGGQPYQMERNDHEGPNAIHGFLRSTLWNIDESSENKVRFSTSIGKAQYEERGYPFSLEVTVAYQVDDSGLTCSFSITNTGPDAAPAAAGFHPYFTTGSALIDEDTLEVPLEAVLELNANLIPTGRVLPVEGTPLDFRKPRRIRSTAFNTCFLQPRRDEDGRLRIHLRGDAGTVTVWMDGAFNYVVLYSGDPLPPEHRRRSLAIEPMTCGSDGFNHPEWGLAALEPGESFGGEWGVNVDRGNG
ncbi:MAG: hypothetical protein M3Y56_11460 [Armatimonadota bacterium]|nr:hypothetical protein [Armatimonadota bacterium]